MLITFGDKQIYAEVYGEGEPLVLLNGIMMNVKSWAAFIPALSSRNKLILIDFLEQGQSSKMDEGFHVSLQADVVKCVLDELEIPKAHVAGISYGASVAIYFAGKYQDRLNKLMLFNGIAYTSPWLCQVGNGWKTARFSPEAYYNASIPIIYSAAYYNQNLERIKERKQFLIEHVFNDEAFLNSMDRLLDSHMIHDARGILPKIQANTLVVGSRDDYLTPVCEQKFVSEQISGANLVVIENCGHASMYEKPDIFASLLLGFANSKPIAL